MKNEITVIGSKSYKECQVVMLPTNKALKPVLGNIFLKNDNTISLCDEDMMKVFNFHETMGDFKTKQIQHLYILSDEEIKEDDKNNYVVVDNLLGKIVKVFPNNLCEIDFGWSTTQLKSNCKLVVATTDKDNILPKLIEDDEIKGLHSSVYLPQPLPQFIAKYIEEYNKGVPILEVLVEYEEILGDEGIIAVAFKENDYKLKTNSNNCITITKVKENFIGILQ